MEEGAVRKGTYWRWIGHPSAPGGSFYNIGITADGSLHNPNGYPEDHVRDAIAGAEERRRQRRSDAAKKAAKTRRERQEKKVYELAQRIVDESPWICGPVTACEICGRGLDDPESIERGIGSDCWQDILKAVTAIRGAA